MTRKRTKKSIPEWIDNEQHLPTWLRDFHDQKDVFKTCEHALGRPVSNQNSDGIGWVDGHVYTIDRFLYFMALHGYALRQVRKDAPNILDTTEKYRREKLQELSRLINSQKGIDGKED